MNTTTTRRLEKQRGERFDALLSHAGVPGFADVAFQSRTTHLQQVHAPILLRYCTDIDRISAGKSGRRYCLKLCRYCPNFSGEKWAPILSEIVRNCLELFEIVRNCLKLDPMEPMRILMVPSGPRWSTILVISLEARAAN